MPLTGKFTFRRSLTGKLLLQVEEEVARWRPFGRPAGTKKRWRDAKQLDLAAPEMRALIDLRFKPYLLPQHFLRPEAASAGSPEPEAAAGSNEAAQRGRGAGLLRPVPREGSPAEPPRDVTVQLEARGERLQDRSH
jgi:hypothetical protein